MKIKEKTKKILVVAFVLFIFVQCLMWLMTIDYNLAPDERMKYDICKYIVENGKIPHGGDEAIRDENWGLSYAFTPILSYMFSAVFIKIVSLTTQDFTVWIWAARFVSVICIAGYAFMCYKISEKLFKGIYKWIFTVFVTLLPQIVFLGSYLNNDSLALLSISIIVYSWLLGLEKNWNWKSCIIMSIGLALCALSYYNAYGYILCSIIIYIASCWIKKINIKEFFKKGIIIFLVAFALAGWWFVRSFILYDGDFLGINISREYSEKYAIEKYKPSNRGTPANTNIPLTKMLIERKWIETTLDSFIGLFGNMEIKMNIGIYTIYKIIFIIGILGALGKYIIDNLKKIKKKEQKQELNEEEKIKKKEKLLFNIVMIICLIIPIALSIYYSYFNDFQPQGRYIMPIIIPFMYFITIGLKNIFDAVFKAQTIRNILLGVLIVIWIISPIFIYFVYIKTNLSAN